MSLRAINILYYISVLATASITSLAVDWRPGAGTGLVVRQPEVWWAVVSLLATVGLYLYRKQLLKKQSE